MPSKKITIAPKPQERVADDWVNGVEKSSSLGEDGTLTAESSTTSSQIANTGISLKRLTIDIPEELHTRIKSQCALRRSKMADEIRILLENHFSV